MAPPAIHPSRDRQRPLRDIVIGSSLQVDGTVAALMDVADPINSRRSQPALGRIDPSVVLPALADDPGALGLPKDLRVVPLRFVD